MMNEVILSRLDELVGEYDTPYFKYLLYSYDLSLHDCEIIVSKIRDDISQDAISGDDNLVELLEEYFRGMCLEKEKRYKVEYLNYLIDGESEFYRKYLAKYEVSPKDMNMIYSKVENLINDENISDFEIKRCLEYYFSNAIKQDSYIRSLEMIVGRNYDALMVEKVKKENPNIYDRDIMQIANELYAEILDGKNFKSIKNAFFDKVMRKSEAKKAEAISKWENLVLGNGDSFNKLLENKHLTVSDGEAINRNVRAMILNGLICADTINGSFLTKLCINYNSE